ncbi:MAG: hypothetical protein ACYTFI_24735 [Planctomycetota bacterium]|jgi:hypothetical protein
MAAEEKAEKKGRSGLSAFLGMVLSGLLSIFIASTMFTVGLVRDKLAEGDERQAIVRFLAVEVADIYAETCRSAHAVFIGNRHSQVVAPVMAGARTLGNALSLDADPGLVAAVRSIHGRYARVQRDVGVSYSFYTKKKKLTQNQIRKVIADCKGMGEEVREVLRVAGEEGVDEEAISRLEGTCAKADALVAALVAQKEKLLPDVRISKKTIDMGAWSGRGAGNFPLVIYNYSDAPVTVTGMSCTLKGFKPRLPHPNSGDDPMPKEMKPDESIRYFIDHPRWPDQLPRGPIEETFTVETDCPGYERITVPIKGVVHNVAFQHSDNLGRLALRRDSTQSVKVWNCTRRPVTIRSATCPIAGVEVSFPRGKTMAAEDRSHAAGCHLAEVRLKFVHDAMTAGPFEGTLTIETDSPGYESVKIPIKGTVEK